MNVIVIGPRAPCFALVGALLLVARTVHAAPEVQYLFPAGGQRGQTVTVTAGGKFPQWPADARVNKPGLEVTAQEKSGTFSVRVADDAQPGLYWIRLFDGTGAAAPQPFVVGRVTEILEAEPNNDIRAVRPLETSAASAAAITVNGRLAKGGDVDVFAISVAAGRTLVADLDAHTTLGSPLDAVLQIVSPDGFVYAHNDDQLGLDPQLAVEVPRDGVWFVRVFGFPAEPNSTIGFAGNDTYIYRLTISSGAYVDYAVPMVAERGVPTTFAIFGWNLPDAIKQFTPTPADATELVLEHAELANALHIPLVPHAAVVESEPNATESPQEIALPVSVTGRIDGPGDRDTFEFPVRAGDIVNASIESRTLGFALDPVLELTDHEGGRLAFVDDAGGSRDAELTHTATADGRLRLVVSDLHRDGGPRFVYRLAIELAAPGYDLDSDVHQATIAPGGTVQIPLSVARLHGYNAAITLAVDGLPAGVSAAESTSAGEGDSAAKVTLELKADAEAAAASVPVRILGRAADAPPKTARIGIPGHSVPGHAAVLSDVWLTVTPAAK